MDRWKRACPGGAASLAGVALAARPKAFFPLAAALRGAVGQAVLSRFRPGLSFRISCRHGQGRQCKTRRLLPGVRSVGVKVSDLSIRVAIADDHPVVLRGLASELERNPAIRLVGQATDSTELIALLDRNSCDVLVLDYAMPGGSHGDGLVLISHLRRRWLDLRVVLYTMVDNPALLLAIVKHGVKAVVSKSDSMSRLVDGVYAAHGGRRYYSPLIKDMLLETMMVAETDRLTPREAEIVRLFCAGGTITEIAERLHRSVQTVSTQKRSAMRKLGVSRDVDLIKLFSDIPQKTQAAQG
jgi:two-component system capsular synthesis response regulator RcsB